MVKRACCYKITKRSTIRHDLDYNRRRLEDLENRRFVTTLVTSVDNLTSQPIDGSFKRAQGLGLGLKYRVRV